MQYRSFLKKIESQTFSLSQWLLISSAFSCLLLAARVIVTGENTFLFLIWNLFLAFIPYAISEWLSGRIRVMENKVLLALVLTVWLLFIPNAFYIVTDLFHLHEFGDVPGWFDLALIFSFAWNGLLLGVLSVRRIETILQVITGRSFSLLFVFFVMWLNAFGVYIGRYLRFNSWDVISKPFSLFSDLFDIIIHPLKYRMDWGMIFVYSMFMTVLYLTLKKAARQF
ncbi:DUF1361 domain-containing protein [Terrimonas sp. NA20]|uniref:DUF1361 domain-containing protein n=1 Tax=Terrimonas ginsenosidimutans TaxID=2908004 RepID=A0ABS9KZW3_9BACT|nr:DUF1361 domain-containing protein [Terrimonas ginsenosidimutans]MCG2617876.1 DUF1361 domain-containing protein [Terrimonas ginsenosidimutans]